MSTFECLIIGGLVALNVWQHWFWSKYTGQLIDKLMSRNYAEYKQIEQSSPLPMTRTQSLPVVTEDAVLNELNSMLGGN